MYEMLQTQGDSCVHGSGPIAEHTFFTTRIVLHSLFNVQVNPTTFGADDAMEAHPTDHVVAVGRYLTIPTHVTYRTFTLIAAHFSSG